MQALFLQALDPIAKIDGRTQTGAGSGRNDERRTPSEQCHIVLSNRGGARWIFKETSDRTSTGSATNG